MRLKGQGIQKAMRIKAKWPEPDVGGCQELQAVEKKLRGTFLLGVLSISGTHTLCVIGMKVCIYFSLSFFP